MRLVSVRAIYESLIGPYVLYIKAVSLQFVCRKTTDQWLSQTAKRFIMHGCDNIIYLKFNISDLSLACFNISRNIEAM